MNCVWTTDEDYEKFCSEIRNADLSRETLEELSQNWIDRWHEGISLSQKMNKSNELVNRVLELDFLTPYIEEDEVSEIMVNGTEDLFVERGTQKVRYKSMVSEQRLNGLIQKIVSSVNRAVNLKEPIVDARLANGSRVHIVLKPIALNGPIITIRKFKSSISTLESLELTGSIDGEMRRFLGHLVKSRKSIFVSGSTSSGKTTLLNCLCSEIGKDDRVITIEDSAELNLGSIPNLVSMETRTVRQKDLPPVDTASLIKASLRMRPDRIIVGEIRGPEAHDMLQAMNTGHEGSMSTGHANSAKDMLRRIELMALSSGLTTPEAVSAQIMSGIQYVIHMGRTETGKRRIMEILKMKNEHSTTVETETIYAIERGWCI